VRDHVSSSSVVEMTRALVAADSQNPPGRERLVADVARQLLEPLCGSVAEVEAAPGRVSLVGRIGDCSRPTLLVNGHLDTVPADPNRWAHDPFGGEVADGRIWGRGTADMKGGVAAAIEAVLALGRAGIEPPCDVLFHLVADEERGGRFGTQALLDRGLITADACVVPEPTSLDVCIAERGLLHVDVLLHGRPAHASEPRVLPGQAQADAVDDVRRLIDAIDDPDLIYDLEPIVFGEASELAPSHPWTAWMRAAIAGVIGRPPAVIGMPFATDARFVRNQRAIPAVVCGPGSIDQAHVDDEWVAIDALVDAAAVYATLMAGFDDEAVAVLHERRTAPTR